MFSLPLVTVQTMLFLTNHVFNSVTVPSSLPWGFGKAYFKLRLGSVEGCEHRYRMML